MGFNRNQFKGTKIKSLREQQEQEEALSSKGNKPVHDIAEGPNTFRYYPPHPGSDLFMLPLSVWYLPTYKEDDQGKKKLGKKRIFNGKIHSRHERDIVAEYIRIVTREGASIYSNEGDLKEYLKHIHGYGRGQSYVGGLSGPVKMVGYAEKFVAGKKQGVKRVEVPMLVKSKMNDLAIVGDVDNDSSDPYSDPDHGVKIVITKDKTQKQPVDKYKVAYAMPIHTATIRLTDEELEAFSALPSLTSLYVDTYKRTDLEYAIEGLRIFDEKHRYGIFDMEEWADIVQEFRELFPHEDEDNSPNTNPSMQQSTPTYQVMGESDEEEEDEEEEEDGEINVFNRLEHEAELKNVTLAELKKLYKKENKGAKTYKSDTRAKLIKQIIDERELFFNEQQVNNPPSPDDASIDFSLPEGDSFADDLPF